MKQFFLALALCVLPSAAQASTISIDTLDTPEQNWSLEVGAGIHSSASYKPAGKLMRPLFMLGVKRQFTPVFGLVGEVDLSMPSPSLPNRNQHRATLSVLGDFNLSTLFYDRSASRSIETHARVGFGLGNDFADNAGSAATFPVTKIGLDFEFHLGKSRNFSLLLRPQLVFAMRDDNLRSSFTYNIDLADLQMLLAARYYLNSESSDSRMAIVNIPPPAVRPTPAVAVASRQVPPRQVTIIPTPAPTPAPAPAPAPAPVAKAKPVATIVPEEENNASAEDMANAAEQYRSATDSLRQLIRQLQATTPSSVAPLSASRVETYVVKFAVGRALVNESQKAVLDRIVIALCSNPKARVIIRGYASPEGRGDVNLRLAYHRAEDVKQCLMTRYMIDEDRIEVVNQSSISFSSDRNWSRSAVCTIIAD